MACDHTDEKTTQSLFLCPKTRQAINHLQIQEPQDWQTREHQLPRPRPSTTRSFIFRRSLCTETAAGLTSAAKSSTAKLVGTLRAT